MTTRTRKAVAAIAVLVLVGACLPAVVLGAEAQLTIRADQGKETISKNIYGNFAEHLGACIYGGFWVGEDSPIPNTRGIRKDVVEALKATRIPVLRWPGGCFADEYHWKDGIGPRAQRPKTINTHWGMVTETNAFGTHEFMDLCEQLGCDAYIAGNVGSGTPQEMEEWVEYMTSSGDSKMANLRRQNGRDKPWVVKYFGVGNENWGCGGNMTPEYYSDVYKRFQTYVRNYSGNNVTKVACGSNGDDYKWTESVMANVGPRMMNALSLHYYTVPTGNWNDKGSATKFDEAMWHATLRRALEMQTIVSKTAAIMDKQDSRKQVSLFVDEWGVWHNVEPGTNPGFLYQQNTLRDALAAAMTFNIFNNACDRVKMANIAQTINVLQSVILTDGPKMVLTPTYYVFRMYMVHQDATLLPTELKCPDYKLQNETMPAMNVSASKDASGRIHVSLCNADPRNAMQVRGRLQGAKAKSITGEVLTADDMTAHNTFEKPGAVTSAAFKAASITETGFTADVPAKSIVVLTIE
jgi:alpha-L-arabinofuranosidase